MKKILFFLPFLMMNVVTAQIVLLNEDFESYEDFTITNMGQWSLLDLDQLNTTKTIGGDPAPPVKWVAAWPNAGAKMAFQIFNFSQSNATNDFTGASGDIRNFNPRSGQKYAACWAGQMVQSFQGNNDWLITPAVILGSSGNEISMYLKTLSSSYGDERFQIGVYVGSGNPSTANDFAIINTLPYQQVPQNLNIDNNWRNFKYNLDAYSGQQIRIGIRCVTQEASALLVDDVKITTTGVLSTSVDLNDTEVIFFPDPVEDVINIKTRGKITEIKIYSIEGKLILTTPTQSVDISHLSTGTYIVKVLFSNGKEISKKILKK